MQLQHLMRQAVPSGLQEGQTCSTDALNPDENRALGFKCCLDEPEPSQQCAYKPELLNDFLLCMANNPKLFELIQEQTQENDCDELLNQEVEPIREQTKLGVCRMDCKAVATRVKLLGLEDYSDEGGYQS